MATTVTRFTCWDDEGHRFEVVTDSRDLFKARGLAERKGTTLEDAGNVWVGYALCWFAAKRTGQLDPENLSFDAFAERYALDRDQEAELEVGPTQPATSDD